MGRLAFLDCAAFAVLSELAERKRYLRELAEATGFSPAFIHKVVSRLVKEKVLLVEWQKNRKVFSPNYASPLALRALSLAAVYSVLEATSFKSLLAMKPIGVYLFGTAASGRITADSDIDLAVFFGGKPDSFRLSGIKRGLGGELKREVQLVALTPGKVESMRLENAELLNQIRLSSVVLWGEMFG